MAAYVRTRIRTLRGLGATYALQPLIRRSRALRGFGDDIVAPDLGPLPAGILPTAPLIAPPPDLALPTSFFTFKPPVAPPFVPQKVVAPTLAPLPAGIAPFQLVLPSQGTVAAPPKFAPVPPSGASWFDQEMIAGFPNKYLALTTIGLVFFVNLASGGRRRR